MAWEQDRYSWATLRANMSAENIPTAIESLRTASSQLKSEQAYWKIDNTVIVQGALFEAALPVVSCLLEALLRCTDVSRPYILELLVQIGSGEPSMKEMEAGNTELDMLCRRELCLGVSLYFDLLENGTDEERIHCVDLLGICSDFESSLKNRFLWYLNVLLTSGDISDGLRELLRNWIMEFE